MVMPSYLTPGGSGFEPAGIFLGGLSLSVGLIGASELLFVLYVSVC